MCLPLACGGNARRRRSVFLCVESCARSRLQQGHFRHRRNVAAEMVLRQENGVTPYAKSSRWSLKFILGRVKVCGDRVQNSLGRVGGRTTQKGMDALHESQSSCDSGMLALQDGHGVEGSSGSNVLSAFLEPFRTMDSILRLYVSEICATKDQRRVRNRSEP